MNEDKTVITDPNYRAGVADSVKQEEARVAAEKLARAAKKEEEILNAPHLIIDGLVAAIAKLEKLFGGKKKVHDFQPQNNQKSR